MKESISKQRELLNNDDFKTLRKSKKLNTVRNTEKNTLKKKKRQTKAKTNMVNDTKKDVSNKKSISNEDKIINLKIKENNTDATNNKSKQRTFLKPKSNKFFDKLNCNYILKYIFEHLREKKNLRIVQHNKELRERLEISLNEYKKYKNRIEIIITPIPNPELKDDKNIFININENKKFYHIYFNNSRAEAKRNYITKEEKVTKIRVLLECGIKSLEELFKDCKCIKAINFVKYKRNDITNMSKMFCNCTSLLYLDITNFITYRVTNMSSMFSIVEI